MFKPIHPFRYFSQAVLPTAYSNSLSYLEDVDQMREKLNQTIAGYNELIEYYNSLGSLLDEMTGKLSELDDKMADFEVRFSQLQNDIETQFMDLSNQLTNHLDESIQDMEAKLDDSIEQMRTLVNEMLTQVQTQLDQMRKEMNDNNLLIMAKVEARLAEFLANLPDVQNVLVNDPVTGKTVTISEALRNLYQYFSYFSMTSSEYDSLALTSEQYDQTIFRWKHVTSTLYDRYGRWIFLKGITRFLRSAYEKGKVLLAKEIGFNTRMIADAGVLTSSEYDDLQLNSSAYDEKQITSTQYSWKANRILQGV